MPIDIVYFIWNSLVALITSVVFFFCFVIYKNTKGASLAYKKWAIATFLLLLSACIWIFAGLVFECNESSSTDKNELNKLVGDTVNAFGYFYLPLGAMYFSKDMGFGSVNEDLIKKSQIIFYSAIIVIFSFLAVLIPYFRLLKIIGIVFNSIFIVIWLFLIYYYNIAYRNFKRITVNSSWLLISIGIFAALGNDIFSLLYFLVSESVDSFTIAFRVVMAVCFITGFFKLAKMVEAI